MKHSKVFTREDGSRVEIYVLLILESRISGATVIAWLVDVAICSPIEKEFSDCCKDLYDMGYQKASPKERGERKSKRISYFATDAEILEVKLELWEKLKPEMLK